MGAWRAGFRRVAGLHVGKLKKPSNSSCDDVDGFTSKERRKAGKSCPVSFQPSAYVGFQQVLPILGELPLLVSILTDLPRASALMPEQLTTSLSHRVRGPSKMLYLGWLHFLALVNNIAINSFKYILCVV